MRPDLNFLLAFPWGLFDDWCIMFDYDKTVGAIYDCAANPEGWIDTLTDLRDQLGAAYLMVGYADMTPTLYRQTPIFTFRHTEWDVERLRQLQGLTEEVPGKERFMNGVIDQSWTQMEQISREDFEKTRFCREWSGPQGLLDCLIVPFVARPYNVGMFTGTLHKSKGDVFSDEQKQLAELLSPHVRRAIMINDIVDKGSLASAIYQKVLDQLATAVFVLGVGQRLAYTNAAGDALLSDGNFLTTVAGTLLAHRTAGMPAAFEDAVNRAAKGDGAIGISGIGIPLIGKNGERAAAYVLPIAGKDLRGAIGQGHCVVFVAQRGEQQPMALELLRTMFDLTVMEARVALLLSQGQGPQAIADGLKLSVNTVRSHLKHAYAKTITQDQTALSAIIHAVLPPVKEL
jgi:DNA-binding CsgD family transcriptional regulator